MRILVVSDIEWSTENAMGNTISNWLSGISEFTFANLYTRSSRPNNTVCSRYYAISTVATAKGLLHKENVGNAFCTNPASEEKKQAAPNRSSMEKRLIGLLHRKNLHIVYRVDNFLFRRKNWDNQRFADFVNDFRPDILFSFISGSVKTQLLLARVKELVPNSKVVGFIADDVYTSAKSNAEKQRIRERIENADLVYGASEMLCAAYNEQFHIAVKPLYKGCRFTEPAPKNTDTLELVYAGNLYYGRWDTLLRLAKALQRYNATATKKARLQIYSATEVSAASAQELHATGCAVLCGAKPYAEIVEILARANAVLHVESFEESAKQVVRYSFSTKIIDCLQSGSALLAIGPDGIASMEYAKKIPGAIVLNDMEKIDAVGDILAKTDLTLAAKKTRQYALQYHDISNVQAKIVRDFQGITGGKAT